MYKKWKDIAEYKCEKCKIIKQTIHFRKGKQGICNKCTKKDWEEKNPLKLYAQRLRGNAQKRAKQLNWPIPDFDSNYIYQKILNGKCEVTNIEFQYNNITKSCHAKNPYVPSIDRIDSTKPYLKSNIRIVIYMYNICKGEFSHDEVIKFCKQVIENEKI